MMINLVYGINYIKFMFTVVTSFLTVPIPSEPVANSQAICKQYHLSLIQTLIPDFQDQINKTSCPQTSHTAANSIYSP